MEVTTGGAVLRDLDVAAEQERGDESAAKRRVPVDLLLEQADEDRRSLRVADEDDPATLVVMSEVIAEGREHAVVGDQRVREADPGRMLERAEGDLPVDRREHAADLREP